jgi:histidine triad (HIT) family protein
MSAKDTLHRIKKSEFAKQAVGWSFEHLNFAIPVQRLYETDSLMAFHHPKPCYETHILVIPKKAVSDFTKLDAADAVFMKDLVTTVQALIKELGLQEKGYRLIVNGGDYQDFPQLHFHLVSGDEINQLMSVAI